MKSSKIALKDKEHIWLLAEIKKRMILRGWRVKDLAVATGYSERSIYRMFNLKNKPSRDCTIEVCRALGLDFDCYKGIWNEERKLVDGKKTERRLGTSVPECDER